MLMTSGMMLPGQISPCSFGTCAGGGSTGGAGILLGKGAGLAVGGSVGLGVLLMNDQSGGGNFYDNLLRGDGTAQPPGDDEDEDKPRIPTKDELKERRNDFNKNVKPQYWRDQARDSPGSYTADYLARMKDGKAPIGDDGYPMELHHKVELYRGGSNDYEDLDPMTRTEHRLGANYRKNHPKW
jgi:hypothetical protein